MPSRKLLILAALPLLPAAGAPADEACRSTYRIRVQPIFNLNCVACHQDAAPAGGLSLQRTSAPASLLGVTAQESQLARVAPGDPQKSYLYRKLTGTQLAVGGGEKMPLGGQLSEADVGIVSAWIAGCGRQ